MSQEANSVLLDEERRLASHEEVKAAIDEDVKAGITRGVSGRRARGRGSASGCRPGPQAQIRQGSSGDRG